jgi:hypothetical protein
MTYGQRPTWCAICRREGCSCPYCHDARFLRHNGQLIRCDACFPAPDPDEEDEKPARLVKTRAPRHVRAHSDRLNS